MNRDQSTTGWCCFELDNLDHLAIVAGDQGVAQVLEGAARVLCDLFGSENVMARPWRGGFYVRLEGEGRARLSRQVDFALEGIRATRMRGARNLSVGVAHSVVARAGIAWSEEGVGTEELHRRATAAAATARAMHFGQSIHGAETQQTERRAHLICDLASAMVEDRVTILAQEIRSTNPAHAARRQYEVLVQLLDADGREWAPNDFIPIAERSALIEDLDQWIFSRTLLGHAEALRARPEISLSFNISGRTLGQPGTWTFLERVIRDSGIAPSRLQLEITETSEIVDMAQAACNVRCARAAGLSVALDDFGAGLSGYQYLCSLDVSVLKIDGSLVPKVVEPGSTEAEVLRSIVALAERLGLEVVAEHVSTPEILRALQSLGIGKLQGYEVGRSRPLAEVLREP